MRDGVEPVFPALLGAVFGVIITLGAFGVVNGGLLYRKQCPTPEGTVKTDWSYHWDLPIPYILRPSEEGCEVHSGTRVAMSQVGVWKLPHRTAADLERKYASSRTDPGTAYIGNLIASMTELQRATREHVSMKEAVRVMQQESDNLHALNPPDYLRADHQRLLAVYDRSVAEARRALILMRAGDQKSALPHIRASVDATAEFVQIAQRMNQAFLARQGKS